MDTFYDENSVAKSTIVATQYPSVMVQEEFSLHQYLIDKTAIIEKE